MNKDAPYRDITAAQGLIAVIFFLLIPVADLYGPGTHRTAALLHGIAASLTLLVATYTLHAYFGYARGLAGAAKKLLWRLLMTNVLTLGTIVAGNWLYIDYQAPDGAAEWLKLYAPAGHWLIMEYKEFVSLLAFPFGVAANVLLWRLHAGTRVTTDFRYIIGILLTLLWLSLLVGFVFGLLLARWKSV